MNKVLAFIFFVVAVTGMFSCTSKLYPRQYYEQHKATIHEIETLYKKITASRLLSVAFYDLGLDYYVDGKKQYLVFMSVPVKQFSLFPVLQKNKYYLFNFYAQPQYYDEQGRLLDKKKLQQLRKINSEVFRRINEKVCYTISGKFR